MHKLITAVTVSDSLVFLRGLNSILQHSNFGNTVVVSPGASADRFEQEEGANVRRIMMKRNPSWYDFISFFKTLIFLVQHGPLIVNAGTPKAGFLFTLAAWLSRVPIRVYTLHGLRHQSLNGFRKTFQIIIEKLV